MAATNSDAPARDAPPVLPVTSSITRLISLDVMRGMVMVLMAVDRVRVFSGLPAGGPTPGIFFTRWITHFVAPAFAFLAGTAAFLHGRKLGDTGALARYLVTRGAILVLLELTVIRVAWTFNAVTLPESLGWIAQFLYFGGEVQLGQSGPVIAVLYVIMPWVGVMAAGYAFGAIMTRESADRRRLCVAIGGSAIALFLVLPGLDIGDPRHWRSAGDGAAPAVLRFLNTSKYPASPVFLLMTLGPMIALLPLAERSSRTP